MESRLKYSLNDESLLVNQPEISSNQILFPYPCQDSTHCSFYKIQIEGGYYEFELWGAQGGDARGNGNNELQPDSGGKGAYVSGRIKLKHRTMLYLYIGGKGEDQDCYENCKSPSKGGFNGGGEGGRDLWDETHPESSAGGGGATDIRLISGDNNEALKSRIIVAAGGGGAESSSETDGKFNDYRGGHGGTIEGIKFNTLTKVGKQKPDSDSSSSFGKGSSGMSIGQEKNGEITYYGGSTGGGGGGYYGGSSYTYDELKQNKFQYLVSGGAGGSSYVSGYTECNSVDWLPINSIQHNDSSIHYSNHKFYAITMKSGEETKYSGNGKIIIKFLSKLHETCLHKVILSQCYFQYYLIVILKS